MQENGNKMLRVNQLNVSYLSFSSMTRLKICKGCQIMRKKKLEINGGWGIIKKPWNENSRGGGGSKLKTIRGEDMDIFWNHTFRTPVSFIKVARYYLFVRGATVLKSNSLLLNSIQLLRYSRR